MYLLSIEDMGSSFQTPKGSGQHWHYFATLALALLLGLQWERSVSYRSLDALYIPVSF